MPPDYTATEKLEMGEKTEFYLDSAVVSDLSFLMVGVEVFQGEMRLTVETSRSSWERQSTRFEKIELTDLGESFVKIQIEGVSITTFKISLEPVYSFLNDPRLANTLVLYDDPPVLLEPYQLESLIVEYRPYWTHSE